MDFLFVTIVAIAALSYLMISVEGFHWRAIPRRTARSSSPSHAGRSDKRNAIFVGSPPMATTALSDKVGVLDDEEEQESENNWTMEEDWVLIDNLPLFTVSSTAETRTFWTQLWSANGILFSTKQPEDLYRRALELKEQRAVSSRLERQEKKLQNAEKNNNPQQSQSSLTFGASPPVLENWKIDLEANDNRVVGRVGMKDSTGQRTIWFHYHVIGRLEGDPFADQSSSAVSLFPGGYIEAVGGRVYELGQPMSLNEWGKETTNIMFNNKQEKIDANTVRKNNDESSTISPWWLPGSTAAVSALVSSTILSACIGYSAGLSIVPDGSHHYQATSPITPTMMLNSSSKAAAAGTKAPTISDSSYQLPSIEERRASTQYKVLREERLVKKISQRLEIDKQNLKQLEEQEQQQQSSQ